MKEERMMVTVVRRPKGHYEAYANQASSIIMFTVEIKITKLEGKVTEYFTRTIRGKSGHISKNQRHVHE